MVRTPTTPITDLLREIREMAPSLGLDAIGVTGVEPFVSTRLEIERRVQLGLHDTMKFTFAKPERSTSPAGLLPEAQSMIVAARSYRRVDVQAADAHLSGRIGRYAWVDHYAPLRAGLQQLAVRLKLEGYRTRVVADDNALVDRAAAERAGVGRRGKNANLLLPGRGSWFVLGSLVTSAPFPPDEPLPDDPCGTCTRCFAACPTDAIVEPGVIDARRCLAWLAQKPGIFPTEFASAMGDRIYGCDDCQDACPPNRTAERRFPPPAAEPDAQAWTHLLELVTDTDGEILAKHGRFYLPGRDPSTIRRNALLALGNIGEPSDPRVRAVVDGARSHSNEGVRVAADWAQGQLDRRGATSRS